MSTTIDITYILDKIDATPKAEQAVDGIIGDEDQSVRVTDAQQAWADVVAQAKSMKTILDAAEKLRNSRGSASTLIRNINTAIDKLDIQACSKYTKAKGIRAKGILANNRVKYTNILKGLVDHFHGKTLSA